MREDDPTDVIDVHLLQPTARTDRFDRIDDAGVQNQHVDPPSSSNLFDDFVREPTGVIEVGQVDLETLDLGLLRSESFEGRHAGFETGGVAGADDDVPSGGNWGRDELA